MMTDIDIVPYPPLDNAQLNTLFKIAWPAFQSRDWQPILERSLCWVGAFCDENLVGFVYVAWNGYDHAWLLDPTVHPDFRRRGIGVQLVEKAIEAARRQITLQWLHVDFEAHLTPFYARCGFENTRAGLMNLREEQ